jgi:thioesterase domain-containing protein
MTPGELAAYLRDNIPLTTALAVEVIDVSDSAVRLRAPLAPNRNHRQTAFGGSVAALAVLAGWGWLHARLVARAVPVRLVIQRQELDYLAPIASDFIATCAAPEDAAWNRFARALDTRGRARIELAVTVTCGEVLAARFSGAYVALVLDRPDNGVLELESVGS